MALKLRQTDSRAIKPTRKHPTDAGLDLYALKDLIIEPWSQVIVDTGWEVVELPTINGSLSVMQIWPRSGMDAKHALHTGAGVIDYSYRGNILVLLKNQSDNTLYLTYGTAIAQALIVPVSADTVEVAEESGEGERGASGGIRGGSQAFMYSLRNTVGDNALKDALGLQSASSATQGLNLLHLAHKPENYFAANTYLEALRTIRMMVNHLESLGEKVRS